LSTRHIVDFHSRSYIYAKFWAENGFWATSVRNPAVRAGSTDGLAYVFAKLWASGQLAQPRLDIAYQRLAQVRERDDGAVDKKAHVFCCLDRLRSTLRRRDLFVTPSVRYADARAEGC
jgi:hypothetical protein